MHRRIVNGLLCVCALSVFVSLAGAQDVINTVAGGGPNSLPATASSIGNPWSAVQFTDSKGTHTYISDNASNRVFEVTGSTLTVVAGNIVGTFGGRTADSFPATEATLNGPEQVAADANGNLYIADTNNQAIRFVNMTAAAITFYNGTAAAIVVNPGTIQTIVGIAGAPCTASPCGDSGFAVQANLKAPGGVWLDNSGNIYIADTGDNVVRAVNTQSTNQPLAGVPNVPPGVIVTVAGTYATCSSFGCGDGGAATSAFLTTPRGVWLDSNNNLYIADTGDDGIRLVNAQSGFISNVAGVYGATCAPGGHNCGDGLPASQALLNNPGGVTADSNGNVYIADTVDQVVRVVSGVNINLFAGNYSQCSQNCGDGGPATSASLSNPTGVFVDASGNVFIGDQGDNAIREVSSGNIQTAFGVFLDFGYSGDANPPSVKGTPVDASLFNPTGVIEDNAGNIYIADQHNNRIRKVTASSGLISNFAGTGSQCPGSKCGDGGAATSALLNDPSDVAVDPSGNVYIADENCLIRVVNTQAASINFYGGSTQGGVTIAPGDIFGVVSNFNVACGFNGDGLTALSSKINFPQGVTVDAIGNIYFADTGNDVVRVANVGTKPITVGGVTIQPGKLNVVAGTPPQSPNFNPVPCPVSTDPCGDGGQALSAMLNTPTGVAIDRSGNIYIADNSDNRIRVVNSKGVISTVAGNGNPCTSTCGDGGPATQATLSNPNRVYADYNGTIYIADTQDYQIRVVNPGTSSITVGGIVISPGDINSPVGSGSHGFTGDGGPATSAELAAPSGIAVDTAGNLLIADSTAWRIRTVSRLATTAPTANAAPNPVVFPATIIGQPAPMKVTVTNNGNGTNLTVSSVAVSGTDKSDFTETNTCTTVPPDGGTCTVTVTFTPAAAGTRTASLNITDNATGSPQVVALSGTATPGLQISPTSQSVSAGSSATYTITVPTQGFSGNVTLSCTKGLPSGAACSFSPATVAPGKTSTLTITTTAPSSSMLAPATTRSSGPFYAIWLLLPAMLLSTAGISATNRRKLISSLLLALAIMGMLILIACGGSSSSGGSTAGGTPSGTYTISVQGASGSTTSTQTVTLTVQ